METIMDAELLALRRRLETMPVREREVFERARFRDMDYPTIAAELGMTVKEVERLMARAMRHLLAGGPADIEQPSRHG
jgi:RNA polymerase sigma factor (sigma-70 family)